MAGKTAAPAAKKAPKNAPADAEDRLTLEAVEPIRIDGVDVAPGEPFNASPADAEPLIKSGAAKHSSSE